MQGDCRGQKMEKGRRRNQEGVVESQRMGTDEGRRTEVRRTVKEGIRMKEGRTIEECRT